MPTPPFYNSPVGVGAHTAPLRAHQTAPPPTRSASSSPSSFPLPRLLFLVIGAFIASSFFPLPPLDSPRPSSFHRAHLRLLAGRRLGPPSPHAPRRSAALPSVVDEARAPGWLRHRLGGFPSGPTSSTVAGGEGGTRVHRHRTNFFTGRKQNVAHHLGNPRFELIRHDVVEPILLEVDQIYHLACPASPVHYKFNPIKTIKTNVMGTLNMLGLAKRVGARFLITSTSEVYGDPLEHPQKETYWGNVNPIGERSCYDEGKRTAETLTMDYHRGAGLEVRIARIFNTYGPRMCIDDGRVVSNFVAQALRRQPMTVYGDGKQTRSFQYVSDLVAGLMALMEGDHVGPFNLGNPGEFTMLELAEVVKETIDPTATIEFKPNTADDPHMRKPDISKAKELLNWEPKVSLREGLPLMVTDFRKRLNEES
ncbi:UDP-glucuronic acid decarboxylase 1-like [Asparagus officinalis]|uniref:UDP-glucuronic acid decarboxylase 1-like n=1 Tax=Asparagus officinalis TaxID=4686 RepID=UPI00098DF85B|nr:UDP-glucuronic acid decarboxylase 1-like [Asparagus officinalis]